LQLHLIEMIGIEVGIAECMHELAGSQMGNLGNHQGKQGIGGDIEGNTEKNIGAALIELAGEPAPGHVELKQAMTGWQGHMIYIPGVPCAYQ